MSPATTSKLLTGEEYLESLRDGREIWIDGERVRDVTEHPAFRNAAGCPCRTATWAGLPTTRRRSWRRSALTQSGTRRSATAQRTGIAGTPNRRCSSTTC
ncbi:MAG: hypothetical protein JO304_18935 [Solirubrobacterales bacterium]|nr:hypothetical protein [Solirubrobacterales bacterium]